MAILEVNDEQIFELALQLPREKQEELLARLQEENSFETTASQHRTPGRYKGKIWVAPDFNDPLPDDIQALFDQ